MTKRFPFDPARMPFFYGWIVLASGTLGMVMSAPGQTVGVSVFTDFLIRDLSLTRSSLSLAYLIGTVASALTLARAGAIYDRVGGRALATGSATALAVVLVALSFAAPLTGIGLPAFLLISLLFFLLRFSGQGMLTLASRNMVMEWFHVRRGIANAVMGVSISFGFSFAPRVFEALIQRTGYQDAWRFLALMLIGFGAIAFLLYRNRPEDHGLVPDGPMRGPARAVHAETAAGRDFTLAEARKTRAFRLFAGTLFLAGLVMTAYTFHIVSIFGDAGLSRARAVAVFFPAAVVAVIVEFIGSWLSDYIKIKWLAVLQLTGVAVLALSIAFLRPGLVVGVIVGHGLMQGNFGILSNVTWPRFFGRRHLGAISGFGTSITVFGTALGPILFSALRDLSGGYAAAAITCAGGAVALIIVATGTERPA